MYTYRGGYARWYTRLYDRVLCCELRIIARYNFKVCGGSAKGCVVGCFCRIRGSTYLCGMVDEYSPGVIDPRRRLWGKKVSGEGAMWWGKEGEKR